MAALGNAFRAAAPPRHIWVVLSDPAVTGGKILLANFTTLRDSCVDDACVLGPNDYAELTHESTVAYSLSRVGDNTKLDQSVQLGLMVPLPDVPAATLQKMLAGGRTSLEMSKAKRDLLAP